MMLTQICTISCSSLLLPWYFNINIALLNPHTACLRPLELFPLHLHTTDWVACPPLVDPAVMHSTAHGAVADDRSMQLSTVIVQSYSAPLIDNLMKAAGCTWRGRLDCPFILPPAVVWPGTSDQNCSATSPSASCFSLALYQPRPCDAVPCRESLCGLLLSTAPHSQCQGRSASSLAIVRTTQPRRQT